MVESHFTGTSVLTVYGMTDRELGHMMVVGANPSLTTKINK